MSSLMSSKLDVGIKCWGLNLDNKGLWVIEGKIRIFINRVSAKKAKDYMTEPKRAKIVPIEIFSEVNKLFAPDG